jgi:flagellar biosynthesis protein FliQ
MLKDGRAMTVESASEFVRHSLMLTLMISAPMLLVGLVVGIIVSIVQAVTQIQEQTLTFVPKITAMIIAAILLLPWIETQLLDYARQMFSGGGLP